MILMTPKANKVRLHQVQSTVASHREDDRNANT